MNYRNYRLEIRSYPVIGGRVRTYQKPFGWGKTEKTTPALTPRHSPFQSVPIGRREAAQRIREYRRLGARKTTVSTL